MRIDRLAATFGRLENDILELSPGLNVVEAPNEAGKSTWAALLRTMFYGLITRDRSETADKRRYAPWSGSPMEGAMDVSCDLGAVTIIRRTARASAPMGAFSALYTGTTAPVPGLDASGCGEALLGISKEVFVRSAFIRQSGLAVDQHQDLERRINALISTGEEDTSYTEASGRLRKQLNARRSDRNTGQLPQLERDIQSLDRSLAELDALSASIRRDEAERDALGLQMGSLQEQLVRHDVADRRAAAQSARRDLERARSDTVGLPSRDELAALRASIPLLGDLERAAGDAQARSDEAGQALRQVEADPPPPLEDGGQAPKLSPLPFLLAMLAGVVLSVVLAASGTAPLPAVLAGAAVSAAGSLAGILAFRPHRRRWEERQTQLAQRHLDALSSYEERLDQARGRLRNAQADLRAAQRAYGDGVDRLLAQVRTFQPTVGDLPGAAEAVSRALAAYDRLDRAQRAWDLLPKIDIADLLAAPPQRPALEREDLLAQLAQAQDRLQALDAAIHTAQGRRSACGDGAELRAQLEEETARRAALQEEHDAIALAMEVLTAANAQLQARFSPALGRRAGEIFARLTGGRYHTVLLDRDMAPSTQAGDHPIPRRAAFLSQGTADQLYLAVRLAVCDLVLPPEKAVPLVLDDALVTFDDGRLAAALDYLVELSEHRQILLFTCQGREAAYLRQARPGRFHLVSL